jgi:hypothetical protein
VATSESPPVWDILQIICLDVIGVIVKKQPVCKISCGKKLDQAQCYAFLTFVSFLFACQCFLN